MFYNEPHMQRFILDPVAGTPLREERGGYWDWNVRMRWGFGLPLRRKLEQPPTI